MQQMTINDPTHDKASVDKTMTNILINQYTNYR